MKDKIVIFGAGAIGRGLLADIAVCNGYEAVFVEASKVLAQKMICRGEYDVHLRGKYDQDHNISHFRVFGVDKTDAVIKEINECLFLATAVGGDNMETITDVIAASVKKRSIPLNILVCENRLKADNVLANAIINRGCSPLRFSCIPCSVERMAKSMNDIDVIVESGQSLYIDETSWMGTKPKLEQLLFCDNIQAYYKRKLYTNNAGHALLAYMGHLVGCNFLYEALENSQIRKVLNELLDVASQVLIKEYGFVEADMRHHIYELVKWRFSNRKLADTVERVARDPLRKLGHEERLVGLIQLLQKNNLSTQSVSRVIAAAMRYHDRNDKSSGKLGQMIAQQGPSSVLEQICGFKKDDPYYSDCLNFFDEPVFSR